MMNACLFVSLFVCLCTIDATVQPLFFISTSNMEEIVC